MEWGTCLDSEGVEEPCSLEEALAWNTGKANLSRCVKPRSEPNGSDCSVCCLLYVLLVTHLRSDARQVCTSLVNSATVSFVESECDVLSVYMRVLLLTCLSSRSASCVSVTFLFNSLHSVGYFWAER